MGKPSFYQAGEISKRPDVHRLLQFQEFLLVFRNVQRVIHIPGKLDAYENDAEHSYALAMAAWFLASHFNGLDKNRVIQLALVHDLVEVHAGDTFFYAHESVLAGKKQREQEAYWQIKKEWSDWPALAETIAEYEELKTAESRFVYALDKVMPILMIYLGEGRTWQQEKITLKMLHERKRDKVALSPEIDEYYQQILKLLKKNRHLFSATQPSKQR